MVQYECPGCGATLTTAGSKGGKVDECPRCGYKAIVPGPWSRRRILAILWALAVVIVAAVLIAMLLCPGGTWPAADPNAPLP